MEVIVSEETMIVEHNPSDKDIRFLDDKITEHNLKSSGVADYFPLAIFLRDDSGRIIAGIYGWIWGSACEILYLWVDSSLRLKGIGSALFEAFVNEAKSAKCTQIAVEAFSFGALDFALKKGFQIIGCIDDYPYKHKKVFLRKILSYNQDSD